MRALVSILALSTGFLVAVAAVQSHKRAAVQQQLAIVTQEAEQKARELADAQAAHTRTAQERDQIASAAAELQEQVQTQQLAAVQAASNSAPANRVIPAALTNLDSEKLEKGGFGKLLSNMMQDPDTKKFIRDQQRLMMDQMYAPLTKQLNLNPTEAAQFKDLLADNAMKATETATSLFGSSATNRAELAKSMADSQKQFDEQLKSLLGEDRFAIYKDYQETVGDRAQLNMFKQQFSTTDYPINDVQTEQLLALIKEERRNVMTSAGLSLPGSGQNFDNIDAMLAPGQAEKMLQGQETVNQRVFERARMFLSPDQLQTFGGFQTNQLQMLRMGLTMARRMMAPDQPQPAAAALNQ